MHEGYIICSNDTKNKILRSNLGLKNFKFLTPSLLKNMLYGSFKPDSIIFLEKNYNLTIPCAIEVIKYLPLIEDNKEYIRPKLRALRTFREALIENGYFDYNPNLIHAFKRYNVTFINPLLDKITLKMIDKLKKITNVYIENDARSFKLQYYTSYKTQEIEAFNAFLEAKEVLKNNPKANIYFLNTNKEYFPLFKRMSESFKISINLDSSLSLASNQEIKAFISGLKENKGYDDLMALITNNDLKNYIIGIINKYNLDINSLSEHKNLFSYLFRNKSYKNDVYDKAIRLGDIFTKYQDNDYVYLFNFNSDFPNVLKDEAYLTKDDMLELGLDTYMSLNSLNREYIINKLNSIKNLKVSFPYRLGSQANIKSELVDYLALREIEGSSKTLGTSKLEDTLSLAAMLDDYNLYGIYNEALSKYNLDYLNYQKFDNKFKGFTEEFISKHHPNLPIKMSYSNVKIYYSCPFNYYLDRILKLSKFEGTLATHIGSYAHKILEESYNQDFDFEAAKAEGKKELTKKEQFFATLMDDVLKDLLEFNQYYEGKMALDSTLCEHEFTTLKPEEERTPNDFDQDINFFGFIDKIKYKIIDDKVYVAIYDYKTGGDKVSLNNVCDGENLQLPSYLFLLNKDSLFKDKKVIVLGMYLQKVNITLIDGLREKAEQRAASFKLKGYSTSNPSDLSLLDPGFTSSSYIQSMSTIKSGDFGAYAKIYNEKSIENLLAIVPDLLEKLKKAIYRFDFPIAPLRIEGNSQACRFCQYKRICYMKEHDYKDTNKKPFEDLMKEDYHGLD